jgi:lysophospholipase L1-like esterase
MKTQPWLTLAGMQNTSASSSSHALKVLPAYTGLNSVEATLQVPRARRLLWLEILLNDQLDLKPWQNHSEVRDAYQKACQWFTTYRSLIQSVLRRVSLPLDHRKIGQRDYRTFAEALQFLAPSSSSTQ